ncbi:MAG: extracellular solute-binding protein [Anaerolineales bacterium]
MRILAPNDPALNALEALLAQRVDWGTSVTIIPWENYRDVLMETLQADVPAYELVCVPGHIWLPELATAGYLAPLDDLASGAALQAYNKADLLPLAAREGYYEDRWYMCPLFSDGHIVFYDPELIALEGDVPTLSTLRVAELAAAHHNPPNRYGIALKAHPSEICLDFLPYLREAGATLLTANSPEGIAALERYCALRAYAPPDTHTYGNAEIAAAIQQGKVALATTWGGQAAPLYLPKNSGYRAAVFPKPWNATWGLCIPAHVADKAAAAELLLQVTGPDVDPGVITAAGSPVRISSYTLENVKTYPWLAAQRKMLETAEMLPLRPDLGIYLGAVTEAVTAAFTGQKTPAEALGGLP